MHMQRHIRFFWISYRNVKYTRIHRQHAYCSGGGVLPHLSLFSLIVTRALQGDLSLTRTAGEGRKAIEISKTVQRSDKHKTALDRWKYYLEEIHWAILVSGKKNEVTRLTRGHRSQICYDFHNVNVAVVFLQELLFPK